MEAGAILAHIQKDIGVVMTDLTMQMLPAVTSSTSTVSSHPDTFIVTSVVHVCIARGRSITQGGGAFTVYQYSYMWIDAAQLPPDRCRSE